MAACSGTTSDTSRRRRCGRWPACGGFGSRSARRSSTYPLLHSAFWLEHRLWGDRTTGYHLVNLSLHLVSALLVAAIVRQLRLPGMWLAAAIFALHPVQVESVAWITEQKNTLSTVFYLASALVYLGFDRTRSRVRYLWASALFVCAVLSKTSTATLPAALLVVIWWQRGRLRWRSDVAPLVPWLIFGAAAGLLTAWVERQYIGAMGEDFALNALGRVLLAGRVVWFYAAKLAWPSGLSFNYPHWDIDPAERVAVPVPGGARGRWRPLLVGEATNARSPGRVPVLRRHALSGSGILQRVSVPLFVRGGSLSIRRQHRSHRRDRFHGRPARRDAAAVRRWRVLRLAPWWRSCWAR